ncbi:MAG: PAS domain S-box protein [Methanoregula sp.]
MHDNHQGVGTDRVLYVDDEPALLDISKIFLESDGTLAVDTFPSAREALDHLKSVRYDAIVSDYQMPEMDGIAFLKTLRSEGNATPFIIFTGKGREEVVIEALNSGADSYIQKGGEPKSQFAELAHKIHHAVERKRADRALKNSEEDYRHLIEHANEAIYVVQDGLLRMVNPRTIEFSGYSEKELLNQPFTRFVHPEDRDLMQDRFKKRIEGAAVPSCYSYRLNRKDGTVWWAELSVVAITWDGHPATLNFVTDITDRKLAEDALRESEERYRQFFKTTLDSVFITTPDGQWIDFNDSLVEMTGYTSRDEMFRVPVPSIYAHPEERDTFLKLVERDGFIRERPLQFRKKDGTAIDSLITIVPLKNPDGSVKAFIGTVRDIIGLKLAEDALRESEERYRQFFKTTLDSVFITTPDGQWIDFNDAVVEMFGYTTREEISGIPVTSFYACPEERDTFLKLVERDGYIKERPRQLRKRDGSVFDALITIVPQKNPDGSLKAFIGTIRDITDQKRAEKALQQSERKYLSLFVHMTEGAALHELVYNDQGVPVDYGIIETNPAFGTLLGISRDAVIGKMSRDAYGVAEPPYLEVYARVALTGEPDVFETYFPHLAKHFSISVYCPYKGSFVTIFEDVTERKRAETALRESEAQLRTLIDTLPDLVWLKDPEGVYRSCNRRFESFFGAAEKDIVGKTDYDFMDKDHGDFFRYHDKAAIEAGGPTANEEEIAFASDGHREILETVKTPVHSGDGRVIGVIGIGRNITGRKRTEEALRQANRKLSLLSGITRHDINNQLTVLRGYLTLLEKVPPDTSSGEYFRKINASAQRISSMIQFTKDYEKIGDSAPVWQDLHTLVDTVAKQAPLGRIAVKNDLPGGTEIFADPLIAKVIYNLMENAVRYGGKITAIRFFVQERDRIPILVCEDDGDGIPAGEKERIFELGVGKNTGLGLALSREILSITGITITENGEPGTGARFEMTVPEGGCRQEGITNR